MFRETPPTSLIIFLALALPLFLFDGVIIAQAISEGALLMTSDRDLKRYSVPIFR